MPNKNILKLGRIGVHWKPEGNMLLGRTTMRFHFSLRLAILLVALSLFLIPPAQALYRGADEQVNRVAISDPTDDPVFQRCRVTPTQECCDAYPNTSLGERCKNFRQDSLNTNTASADEPSALHVVTVHPDTLEGVIFIDAVRLRPGARSGAVPGIQKWPAGGTWEYAKPGDQVRPGDKLYISEDTEVVLHYVKDVDSLPTDESDVTVGPDTLVFIGEYLSPETTIAVDSGEVRVRERAGTKKVSDMTTPTANVTVDGTDVIVSVDQDATTNVLVNEGRVTVQHLKSGETVALAAGEKTTATIGSITPATALSDVEKAQFVETSTDSGSRIRWIIGGVALIAVMIVGVRLFRRTNA
ncbi:MAG: FecR domain-containing protein [Candidatus Kerfeldbacteria bacterium]|nr:FecR domain-containing protein [Candidatus Kerfeldbacteria bacterium]